MHSCIDTETSGEPLWNEPSEAAGQPHLVQAAVLICPKPGVVSGSFDAIVRPDGWVIPPEIETLTGITTAHALEVGLPEPFVVEMAVRTMLACPEFFVAHNQVFDRRIFRIGLMRFADVIRDANAMLDALANLPSIDTMQVMKPICALPLPDGRKGLKPPTLEEAYLCATGEAQAKAHDAFHDASACCTIITHLHLTGQLPAPRIPGEKKAPAAKKAPVDAVERPRKAAAASFGEDEI